MFKSILVGVDSSGYCHHAQTLAFYLARKLHASVLGLHVVDILSLEGPLFNDIAAPAEVESYIDTPRVRETLTARGRTLLEDFDAAARRENINVQTLLDIGVVADQLCECSKSADLVVLGHRGASQAAAAESLGGTAESVARRASGTVLLCPVAVGELRQMALAFDGSERACKAMHAAAELASSLDAELTVLSVSRDPKLGQRRLNQARTYFGPYNVKADFRYLAGHPAQEIVQFIRQNSPDAVFIGAYGHSRIVEMMLGSTTEHVLRNATCPLFLAR